MRDGSSRIFDNSGSGIWPVRFSPDGRLVAAGNFNGEILIWELRSGCLLASLKGHSDTVSSIVFTPDGEGLINGDNDGILKYWDYTSARMSDEKGYGAADYWEHNEGLTFVGHTVGTFFCLMPILRFSPSQDIIRSISISPDGQWIASGSKDDKTVRIWNTGTAVQQCILQGHKLELFSVNFSPVGRYLASASSDGQVRIWTYNAGRRAREQQSSP